MNSAWKNHKAVTGGGGPGDRGGGKKRCRNAGFRSASCLGNLHDSVCATGKGHEVREVSRALCVLIRNLGLTPNTLDCPEGFYTEMTLASL